MTTKQYQTHEEIELKWQLSFDEYQVIQAFCDSENVIQRPFEHRLNQENRFYDSTDCRLRAAQCALRLRRENQRMIITVKSPNAANHDGLARHEEIEQEISSAYWPIRNSVPLEQFLSLPNKVHAALGSESLYEQGGFFNTRLSYLETPKNDAADRICLDHTTFAADSIDYELEIETTDPERCRKLWEERFQQLSIKPKQQLYGKLTRMMKYHNSHK